MEKVELSHDCMTELHGYEEKNEDRLKLLDERVAVLKVQFERLEESVELSDICLAEFQGDQEENEDRLKLLEERVATLKVQNVELRDHLNTVIDALNKVMQLLNKTLVSPPIDNSPQLTVQQVYDMYQTQPPDEEGWQEMTEAVKAAEEYEAQPAQQLFNAVNGFTPDEWKDLLHLA